eukprot:scaffold186981_cov46-Prasinocladus_malaysianus.AAC.2
MNNRPDQCLSANFTELEISHIHVGGESALDEQGSLGEVDDRPRPGYPVVGSRGHVPLGSLSAFQVASLSAFQQRDRAGGSLLARLLDAMFQKNKTRNYVFA